MLTKKLKLKGSIRNLALITCIAMPMSAFAAGNDGIIQEARLQTGQKGIPDILRSYQMTISTLNVKIVGLTTEIKYLKDENERQAKVIEGNNILIKGLEEKLVSATNQIEKLSYQVKSLTAKNNELQKVNAVLNFDNQDLVERLAACEKGSTSIFPVYSCNSAEEFLRRVEEFSNVHREYSATSRILDFIAIFPKAYASEQVEQQPVPGKQPSKPSINQETLFSQGESILDCNSQYMKTISEIQKTESTLKEYYSLMDQAKRESEAVYYAFNLLKSAQVQEKEQVAKPVAEHYNWTPIDTEYFDFAATPEEFSE